MTRVDFYILPDNQPTSLQQFACKLAEKSWLSGKRVLIQTDTAESSQQLDECLWNLREDSFIPHGIATLEQIDQQQPVLISHQAIKDKGFQHVINLSSRPSDLKDNNELIINEILNQDDQRKLCGRHNYKTYRELGYTLEHHNLESLDV